MIRIANGICFQLVWITTVAAAARGLWWPGLLAASMFAAWQVPLSNHPLAELKLLGIIVLAGFGIDSALVGTGLLLFSTPMPWDWAAPIWILALWASFALTLNHSLAGLQRRPLLATGLGLVGGPLAYWIAARAWHAVELKGSHGVALLMIGLIWAVLTPLLLALAERLQRHARGAAE